MARFAQRLAAILCLSIATYAGSAQSEIVMSTSTQATLGGLEFEEGDLIEYDSDTDTATLLLDGTLFSLSENIDAVQLLANGNIILSTQGGATLGGLTFADGDLVEYDPIADTATLLFDESAFSGTEDIVAAHVVPNGMILLTTSTSATIGGFTIGSGDIALYNPNTQTAKLLFNGARFSAVEEIDALSLLSNGNLILSTDNDATLGGLTFNEGDLIEYVPGTATATLYFDSASFETSAENIDAVFVVPEPGTSLSLLVGASCLAALPRRTAREHRASR